MSEQLRSLVGYADIAKALKVSERTVYNYRAKGLMPPEVVLDGNRVRWRAEDINRWIEERQKEGDDA